MSLLPLLLLLRFYPSLAGTCGESCCPYKTVGGLGYTFSHESEAAMSQHHCIDSCVFTEDSTGGSVCFRSGDLVAECCKPLVAPPRRFSQPGDVSWPNKTELDNFSKSINGTNNSCLGLPRFVSIHDPSAHKKSCLNYTGLLKDVPGADQRVCKVSNFKHPYAVHGTHGEPDPNCNANPFITNAHYDSTGAACMTPFQFLNNRNYKKEWKAAFIVTAEDPEDIVKAVKFANLHRLGISVFSTGHDLQDRNAGAGPNTLLIRTTCFQDFTFSNKSIVSYNNKTWTREDGGYATVGAGLSFGTNYWTDLKHKEKGLYDLAADMNREMVGGSCHTVGIVGWTLAGGRGWTTPLYGLGVDQLLSADLVTANGTLLTASYSQNTDLFWALRGGGGGFGIIHSIKIKMHTPSCTDREKEGNMTECYSMWNATWNGNYSHGIYEDGMIQAIKEVISKYFTWAKNYGHNWNAFMFWKYNKESDSFSITIQGSHFGRREADPTSYDSFKNFFGLGIGPYVAGPGSDQINITIQSQIQGPFKSDKYFCEIFYNDTRPCTLWPWEVQRWSQSIRFSVNHSTATNPSAGSLVDDLLRMWQPHCNKFPYDACASGYQIDNFNPFIPADGKPVYDSGGPISPGFRTASYQAFNLGVNSNSLTLTFNEQEDWMHFSLGPVLYRHSDASYFNEAEYTLEDGQWEERFWGRANHCRLRKIKKKYDPELKLRCRHCVGSEVGGQPQDAGPL